MTQAHRHIHACAGSRSDRSVEKSGKPASRHLIVSPFAQSFLNRVLRIVEIHDELVIDYHRTVGKRIAFVDNLHYSAVTAVEGTDPGTRVGAELAAGVDRERSVFEQVNINIGPYIVALKPRTGLHPEIIGIVHNGLLVKIVERDIVLNPLGTSGHADIGLPLWCDSAEEFGIGIGRSIIESRAVEQLLFLGVSKVHCSHFFRSEIPVVLEFP